MTTGMMPDAAGHFGRFGGRFMPEALVAPLDELVAAWRDAMADPAFRAEFDRLLREYAGHGLGRRLWEPPSIPAVGRPGTGASIVNGLVFTIEPIVVGPGAMTTVDGDGWTVRTEDGTPAAQFEHTVMATRSGVEILSQLPVA